MKSLHTAEQAELRRMEPKIAPEATAALFSPDAGTLIPYEYTIALAENAADNGVEVITLVVFIVITIIPTIVVITITGAHAAGGRRHLDVVRRIVRDLDLALGTARVRELGLVIAA